MQSCRPGYLYPIGILDLPLVRHKDESIYMLRLAFLISHGREMKGLMGIDTCCYDRPYIGYYLIRDADARSRELDFELRHWRRVARRQLGFYNTELNALAQRNRGFHVASTPDAYSSY